MSVYMECSMFLSIIMCFYIGIGIMGCGPESMIKDLRNQAAFRNIHCHTEVFNF